MLKEDKITQLALYAEYLFVAGFQFREGFVLLQQLKCQLFF
jgi:hypothetical protein